MPWKCPICGTENKDEVYTCRVCGSYKPEATTRRAGEKPISASLVVEIVESPVESLKGRKYVFAINSPGAVITIGRAVENKVIVPDPLVSRRHLRLIATSSGVVVEDLGSTNGTFLIQGGSERQIKAENVGRSALLRIGATRIKVSVENI